MEFKYNQLENGKCSCVVKVKIGELEYVAVSKIFDNPDDAHFSAEENLRDLIFNNYDKDFKDFKDIILFVNLENNNRDALLLSCLNIKYKLFATQNPLKLDNMILTNNSQSIDILMGMHIASYMTENKFLNNQTLICISEDLETINNIFEGAKTISKEVFSNSIRTSENYKSYSSISEFLKLFEHNI